MPFAVSTWRWRLINPQPEMILKISAGISVIRKRLYLSRTGSGIDPDKCEYHDRSAVREIKTITQLGRYLEEKPIRRRRRKS
jgi:hypothetical protein